MITVLIGKQVAGAAVLRYLPNLSEVCLEGGRGKKSIKSTVLNEGGEVGATMSSIIRKNGCVCQ